MALLLTARSTYIYKTHSVEHVAHDAFSTNAMVPLRLRSVAEQFPEH